ncbi:MAG: hypothetical protein P4L53_09760 [Candidatus Obscuribacterales bacterium]|nr:hypothetical protein [Candidatus Obscuribacterales bacterium]
MTKANEEKTPPASEKNATVEIIIKLFWDSRKGVKDFAAAQKVEQEIAGLAAQVAAAEPNTAAHADALEYHYYMLLWLAKLATGKAERKQIRGRAYEAGAASVSILLQQEKQTDLHAVFSASNLAGNLIREEKRYQDGLRWMRESSTLLVRMAGKKKLPKSILHYKWYTQDYFIALAHYHLGDKKLAKQIVKRILRLAPPLDKASWADLKGIAKAAELFAKIQLDELKASREAKEK